MCSELNLLRQIDYEGYGKVYKTENKQLVWPESPLQSPLRFLDRRNIMDLKACARLLAVRGLQAV